MSGNPRAASGSRRSGKSALIRQSAKGGRSLQVSPDEPDLVAASWCSGVVVHGDHVTVVVEVVSEVQELAELVDLPAHRLLRGDPGERPAANHRAAS